MKVAQFKHSLAQIAVAVMHNDDGSVRVNVNKLLGYSVQSAWQGSITDHRTHSESFEWNGHRVTIHAGTGSFEIAVYQMLLGIPLPWGSSDLQVNADSTASSVADATFTISLCGDWSCPL